MRILCVRDLANGDHLIVSTALTSAQTERKLVVIVRISSMHAWEDLHLLSHVKR